MASTATIRERIIGKREKQQAREDAVLVKAQSKCKHKVVYHWDGKADYSLSYPLRVCQNCGLEEQGSWWSYAGGFWSRSDFNKPVLNNERTISHIDFETLKTVRL